MKHRVIHAAIILIGIAVPAVRPAAAQEWQLQERTVVLDDASISYKIAGAGPPLLLLHGFSGSASWWESMIAELAGTYTLVIPDLPGHGSSTGGNVPYVYQDVAGQLFRLLDHAGIERTHAVGYSAGGILLLHMALLEPERITAMAVVSAVHRATESIRTSLRHWPSFEETPATVKEYWLQIHPGGEPQVRRLISALRDLADTSNNMALLPADLSGIEAPTLIIAGDRDALAPLSLVAEMHEAIPTSAVWVVPQHGHPVLWPDWGGSALAREMFATVLKTFFDYTHGS